MNKNVKQHFETLSVAILCTVFVLSMHQSCSGVADRVSNKKVKENTELKKAQNLKQDTIANFKLEQRVR